MKTKYFAYRSFWPEIETMKRFREAGVNTFNVMVSNNMNSLGFPYTKYPPVWKWNGVYDLAAFDMAFDDILKEIPDAQFICLLDINTPHWWTRYLGACGIRYDSFYELGKISPSQLWRNDTANYMKHVMQHALIKYGDRIKAYMIGCGGATEWHDRSHMEESVYRLGAFRQWLADAGKAPIDIPGRMRRDAGTHDFRSDYKDTASYYNGNDPSGGIYPDLFPAGFGLFRTPADNQDVIDYIRFCNEFNADTVSFFLKEARTVIPAAVELGCFFGYAFSAWAMSGGHLAYEKMLCDENLDFVVAPIIGYPMGEGSSSATIHETIALHGKRMLQEMDQKTYSYNRVLSDCCELPDPLKVNLHAVEWDQSSDGKDIAKKFTFGHSLWANEAQVSAGIKRDGAMALINGDSLWWFDMWGGFYKGEKVFQTLRQLKEIWDVEVAHTPAPVAEVLLVVDPDNMYLLNDLNERCGTFYNFTRKMLAKSGVPYETCSFNDLKIMETARFKLVVMCHPFFLPADKRALLDKKILNGNRCVLWCYGNCINEHGAWAPEASVKLCGIEFGTVGLQSARMHNWTSYYIHAPETLDVPMMRELVQKAACHIYLDKPRPVYANSRLVALHTAVAEELSVVLPRSYARITELFTGTVWENTSRLSLTSNGPDTFLLRLEGTE